MTKKEYLMRIMRVLGYGQLLHYETGFSGGGVDITCANEDDARDMLRAMVYTDKRKTCRRVALKGMHMSFAQLKLAATQLSDVLRIDARAIDNPHYNNWTGWCQYIAIYGEEYPWETEFFTNNELDFLGTYVPEDDMITSKEEVKLIMDQFHLGDMSVTALQNLRNEVVKYYRRKLKYRDNNELYYHWIPAMQSITTVIDHVKYNKGGEV